ncbi:ketopantoate reductase [Lipomyces doorenjongii]|uniref:ketopantoate reductase n=1 Tax=Lipomyces doorenjongii TaxID=383834 RepID=UPI0034CDC5D0
MRSITTTISTSTQANRVHILGLGSIGNFVAHSLSEIPNGPSVTLLLHRKPLLDAYKKRKPNIGRDSRKQTYKLGKNGSGMIEEVNAHLFTNPNKRPSYLIGVISHGVTLNSPFNITHTGFSATSVRPVPWTTNHQPLPPNVDSIPRLNLTSYSYTSILQIQLEKLAVNAFCNPLCALNDSRNGFLFTIPETRREILTEISDVVLALPELKHALGLEERFSVDNLENTVNGIIQKTYNTTCSMVWDLRAGRETEVRFINGSWSRMGRRVGVKTTVNDRLVAQVEERTRMRMA